MTRVQGKNRLGETWWVESSSPIVVKTCCFCLNPVQLINPATEPVEKIRFIVGNAKLEFNNQQIEETSHSPVCPWCGVSLAEKND